MNIFIAFEVNNPEREPEIIERLLRMNYKTSWKWENNIYDLPHNCIWKGNTELTIGKAEIEGVVAGLNNSTSPIALTSCIVLSATPYEGMVTRTIHPT